MGQHTVNDLIELIYEAALFQEKWQEAARAIAESVGGQSSSVCWIDKKLRAVTRFDINNFDDSVLPEYAERFGHRDPRVLKGVGSAGGTVYRDHEITPEFNRIYGEYYDFIDKIGVYHSMILIAENTAATTVGFNIYRERRKEPFEDDNRQLIQTLSRHINKAVALSRRFSDASTAPLLGPDTFLSLVGLPAFLLDCRGLVTSHNQQGEALLRRGDPLIMRSATLLALTATQQTALENIVGLALKARMSETAVISEQSGAQHVAEAIPLARPQQRSFNSWSLNEPCILMTVRPLEPRIDKKPLTTLLGFTQAEADVAALLATGHDVEAISRMRGVSLGTTRLQIKSAFAKANVSSQAHLVSRVLSVASLNRLGSGY